MKKLHNIFYNKKTKFLETSIGNDNENPAPVAL